MRGNLQKILKFYSSSVGLKIRAFLGVSVLLLIAAIVIYQFNLRKNCLRESGAYTVAQVIKVGPVKLRKRKRIITIRYEAMGQYYVKEITKRLWLRIELGDKYNIHYCADDPSLCMVEWEEKVW